MSRAVAELCFGLVAFILTGWLLRLTASLLVWIRASVVMLAAAELLRRRTRWRW